MYRLLRWLAYLIGLLLLILIIGYVAAQVYKPKILETINRELNNGVHGDFHIGNLDFTLFDNFPNFSIVVSDIYLRAPRYATYHKDFLHADKIYVRVKLIHLLRGTVDLKSISIRNGNIFIFRTTGDYTNMDVFKKAKADTVSKKSGALSLDLENILFENTRITFVDSLKRKSFDIRFEKTTAAINTSDSSRSISLNGPMWFGGLTFNQQKGGYLPDATTHASLNLEFIPETQQMIVHPSVLQFAKSKVDLKGIFAFKAPGTFSLFIHSDAINYGEGLTLITRALREKLSKFQFDTPLKLDVSLVGRLAGGEEPKIDIAFSTANNHFTTGKISVEDLSLAGCFTNHIDTTKIFDDYNSRIVVDTLSGKAAGIPTNARLSITNLKDPELLLASHSKLHLSDLNQHSDTTRLHFLSGEFMADIQYHGRLNEYLNGTGAYKGKLRGDVTVTDASAEVVSQQKKIDQVNVKIHFTEKHMDLHQIDARVNGNKIQLKGLVTGFIPFFFVPEEKGFVKLSVYSPRLDLATLIKKKPKVKPQPSAIGHKKISDLIDVLVSKVEFEFNIKVDEVLNGPFHASQLYGKLKLHNDQFLADPIKMQLADGSVLASVKMRNLDQPVNPVVIKANVRNADIEKFFTSFNNFSQSTIKSNNLSGKIFTDVELNAQMDEQFNVLMPSLDGSVDLRIRDGKLKDFEPLQNMSNFLLKKRDFTEVQFAEITCRFRLSGPTLDISKMEIQSSDLTLFVQGRYSLADSTDLSIQVPLSNLKKRAKDYKPENVGVDAKVGPSVFLRAHKNKDGKMVITYDPFKKFKKK